MLIEEGWVLVEVGQRRRFEEQLGWAMLPVSPKASMPTPRTTVGRAARKAGIRNEARMLVVRWIVLMIEVGRSGRMMVSRYVGKGSLYSLL